MIKEYDSYMRPVLSLGHCHFKGGGSTTTVQQRNIPAQTANEAALEKQLLPYAQSNLTSATDMINKANSSLNSVPNVDWNSVLANYTKANTDNLNAYQTANNGYLNAYQNTTAQNLADYNAAAQQNLGNFTTDSNANLNAYKTAQAGDTATYDKSIMDAAKAYQQAYGNATSTYQAANNSNLADYNNQMKDVTQGYTDLSNGILPAAYAAARQKALNSDLTGTVGSAISSLANRGIVNSTVTNSALNNISQNASDTLAKNYTSDLATESGLLGNRATNIGNVYNTNQASAQNNYNTSTGLADKTYGSSTDSAGKVYSANSSDNSNFYKAANDNTASLYAAANAKAQNQYANGNTTASNLYGNQSSYAQNLLNAQNAAQQNNLNGTAAAQAASYVPASTLYGYASQLATPAQNMYNTMYSGRMGTGSTTTTQSSNDGGSTFWGIAGNLGAARIASCFTADTLVTTPDGYKSIKDIALGDDVLSIENGEIVTKQVKKVNAPHWMPIVDLKFDNGTIWHTTASQRYYDGKHFSYIDYRGKAVVFHGKPSETIELKYAERTDLVYDFAVDGTNVFFANDVAAEGYGD